MDLESKIDTLPSTSPVTIRRLKSIGISTYWDLLNYFPSRWENYSTVSSISRLQSGEIITIQGNIISAKNIFTRKSLTIQKIILADNTGKIEVVWYNQPYLIRLFNRQAYVSISGTVKMSGKALMMEPKSWELANNFKTLNLIHTGRLIPVYPEKNGLTSRLLREKIYWLIKQINNLQEPLPTEIIKYNNLITVQTAYTNIHFPNSLDEKNLAKNRLAFDELFVIQLAHNLIKKSWDKEKIVTKVKLDQPKKKAVTNFIKNLPFKLTGDQVKVTHQIFNDMTNDRPMNRFLQGDVGSGKTVVATLACYLAYLNGYQSLIMAPTEILANQHYQTINKLFKKLETLNSKLETNSNFKFPKIGLQTKAQKVSDFGFRISDFDIIIGTHALLTKKIHFNKVALVIIDEQHRFGVNQRAALQKKGFNPHLLTMTATPIPRTIALTLYGQLDISYIDQMPQGRLSVKTFFVPKSKRRSGYEWIKKEIITKKIQVFVVCPLIEESDHETMQSVKAANQEYARLKNNIFTEFKLGLIHGKLKSKEKENIMLQFKKGDIDILVATSIVEVGIDMANAAIMIIEGAERYGLAQLHQLRGRVGRGDIQSYCFLFTEKENENIIQRLKFFAHNSSGLKLAEYDLKDRGPGEIFGTKQHGYIDLKIASLLDYRLIDQTKKAVNYFIKRYKIGQFPLLKDKIDEYDLTQVTSN